MADSSKTVTHPQTGSSKLELPTRKRGSSVTVKPNAVSSKGAPENAERMRVGENDSGGAPATDQPTAISKQPPIDINRNTATTRLMAKSLVGRDLLHFHVAEFVGGGGMGAVFRGTDTTLRRTVAIKVLSQDHVDEEMIRRFRHEAESAAKLDHPAMPHVYYVGEDDGWYFIVFEFIEGRNIRDYVADQGPLSIPQAITFLADIADAVQHASRREVVHRDIKPSNVLVTNEGRAHLVDMGLARSEQLQSTANELTATGVTLGTFDYISPEQAKDPRNVDTRSDIYSLGCTLYFMLTGQPPFPEGTMLQKLLSHTSESPPDPRGFRTDIPERMTDLLARMLAKDPAHRQQTASELQGDILLLAEEQNVKLNSTRQTQIIVQRPIVQETGFRRHIPWLVPLVVLVGTTLALQALRFDPSVPSHLGDADKQIENTNAISPVYKPVLPDVTADDSGTDSLRTTGETIEETQPVHELSDPMNLESSEIDESFRSTFESEGSGEIELDDMGFPIR